VAALASFSLPTWPLRKNWQAFSEEWQTDVLVRFSIPCLHAVELRSLQTSTYKHLDIETRKQLLAVACDVIVSRIEAGFVT
jgi:hypothetical protein